MCAKAHEKSFDKRTALQQFSYQSLASKLDYNRFVRRQMSSVFTSNMIREHGMTHSRLRCRKMMSFLINLPAVHHDTKLQQHSGGSSSGAVLRSPTTSSTTASTGAAIAANSAGAAGGSSDNDAVDDDDEELVNDHVIVSNYFLTNFACENQNKNLFS